jgi:hypothetical protein
MVMAIETSHNFTSPVKDGSNAAHAHEDDSHLKRAKQFVKDVLKPKMRVDNDGGVEFYLENREMLTQLMKEEEENKNKVAVPSQTRELFSVPSSYAYTGYGLAKYNSGKGADKILIGTHGTGSKGNAQNGRIDLVDNNGTSLFSYTGPERYTRFGYSVTVLDMNHDGFDDFVVSAPAQNLHEHHYDAQGQILIFLSRNRTTWSSTPDWIIKTKSDQQLYMGKTLKAADVDGDALLDLIIASPYAHVGGNDQVGSVSIFKSGMKWNTQQQSIAYIEDADWTLVGENRYDLFGSHVEYDEKRKWLMVGAPSFSVGSLQSVGKFYAYVIDKHAKLAFSIVGTNEFDRLGSHFALGAPDPRFNTLLALSAITRTTEKLFERTNMLSGSVFMINFDQLNTTGANHELKNIKYAIVTEFNSNQNFARLGYRVGFADLNKDGRDDLYISEPYRQTSAGHASGAVYVWYGGNSFPHNTVWDCAKSASSAVEFNVAKSKFGSEIIAADVDGDGVSELVISAPRQTKTERYQGVVHVLKLK